jgi:hypothetical protein
VQQNAKPRHILGYDVTVAVVNDSARRWQGLDLQTVLFGQPGIPTVVNDLRPEERSCEEQEQTHQCK